MDNTNTLGYIKLSNHILEHVTINSNIHRFIMKPLTNNKYKLIIDFTYSSIVDEYCSYIPNKDINIINNLLDNNYIKEIEINAIRGSLIKSLCNVLCNNITVKTLKSNTIISMYDIQEFRYLLNKNLVIRLYLIYLDYTDLLKSNERIRSIIIILLAIVKCRIYGYNKLVADMIIKYIYPSLLFY
jgi:hypothetical protein